MIEQHCRIYEVYAIHTKGTKYLDTVFFRIIYILYTAVDLVENRRIIQKKANGVVWFSQAAVTAGVSYVT